MENMNCPLCKEEIYSEMGKGCKMCGMSTHNKEKFCSGWCKHTYEKINKSKGI